MTGCMMDSVDIVSPHLPLLIFLLYEYFLPSVFSFVHYNTVVGALVQLRFGFLVVFFSWFRGFCP